MTATADECVAAAVRAAGRWANRFSYGPHVRRDPGEVLGVVWEQAARKAAAGGTAAYVAGTAHYDCYLGWRKRFSDRPRRSAPAVSVHSVRSPDRDPGGADRSPVDPPAPAVVPGEGWQECFPLRRRLPLAVRTALYLHCCEGLSMREASAAMGHQEKWLDQELSRARKRGHFEGQGTLRGSGDDR